MASVRIFLNKNKKSSDGKHPIIIQLIHERKKKIISLRHYAKYDEWDEDKGLPKAKHPNAKSLSVLIRDKLNQAEKIILDYENDNKPFTVDDIALRLTSGSKSELFFKFTEQEIKKLYKIGKQGNAKVYQNTLNVFKAFREDRDILLKNIGVKTLIDFQDYLIEKGNKVNTISVHMRTLRAIHNKGIKVGAVKEEYYPFKKFSIKSEKTKKRALRKEDIDRIKGLDLAEDYEMNKARDIFLFSFYNRGMSFIDIVNLRVKDIKNGRINYSRQKTGQKFSIKLTSQAEGIIKKYNDLKDPSSYLFPIIKRKSEEYLDYKNAMRLMNKKLKKIAEKAEIDMSLTTYVSRHSWATIAKRMGISTSVISEGLGHESEHTTQIYLDSFDNDVIDDANAMVIGK